MGFVDGRGLVKVVKRVFGGVGGRGEGEGINWVGVEGFGVRRRWERGVRGGEWGEFGGYGVGGIVMDGVKREGGGLWGVLGWFVGCFRGLG